MTIEELGQIRTQSDLLTTVNLTLIDEADFDIDILKKYFVLSLMLRKKWDLILEMRPRKR